MLSAIINFSIKNKLIIGLLTIGLIIWGGFSVMQLPIDAVPDITNNQVQIITVSPSLAAPEIERLITFPIEQANANIPGIVEIRSFSRFGLSVVTIVFEDNVNVYWARQQVSERLQSVRTEIPQDAGNPELAPVTTGLGEIYQYVVKAKAGYEHKYSAMDLRTIQDWVVRRQLLGTPGVADVSSFGGLLKQYEVAINPVQLKSMGLTINDIFSALEENNQNTGGAYIEHNSTALFIRSEGLVHQPSDIENIVIKHTPGAMPILIGTVAQVRIGNAVRYGAMTYNNEGEIAGAVVMMLKGENSSRVISAVKKRIDEIQKILPEGVVVEPFLDRTKMVNNAISTVETNLIEGALIVVFILVLFLGNIRAGIVVASVIPLSMLIAVILMNAFGVSGNLMSLGALDFGLIIDGAVIIVEAVLHRLTHGKHFAHAQLTSEQMNDQVQSAAGRMMSSAVFGQIIILIVYLPILTLEGIEGKMFKPMAQTVAFAIIGAFILSLTYVPMMSSLFLSKKISHKQTLSDKMMYLLDKLYVPSLSIAIRKPIIVLGSILIGFVISVSVLLSMGGEFIPELEEGDFAVDTRLMVGTSLSNTIDATQQAAGILKNRFPEVEKVVTKIGSGEIPTDPMPIEASDMMVILKDKKEWKSAKTFDELANKMGDALSEIPGLSYGFQFPVQMRFNELMTGARQDVVCKIFGEDLDTLGYYAEKLGKLINSVNGAKDLYVEHVTGLPQIVITYNREALARYGVSINDVNKIVRTGLAGESTGKVYEGERRFNLVVRIDSSLRKNINDIADIPVMTYTGEQVPLSHLANVGIKDGVNQIQREDAKRRIIVGFNVRERDVQTVVQELRTKVESNLDLPPGYRIVYGGQFENLEKAKERLLIAVPAALLLILVMLYFAFRSLSLGFLIFTAIPLSSIGGILALYTRGMPFSISAGIGFIALFGVAVLNGIVLISEFSRLNSSGLKNLAFIVLKGTRARLRPVLMTAAVASLGFLPMALSNGAGAEVQRPLATVVIGGLISSTFLTLIVLPILYIIMEKMSRKKVKRKKLRTAATTIGILLFVLPCYGQISILTIEEKLLKMADENNFDLRNDYKRSELSRLQKKSAMDIPKTDFTFEYGQINSASTDNKLSISQTFAFPTVYSHLREYADKSIESVTQETRLHKNEIHKKIKLLLNNLAKAESEKKVLLTMDSIMKLTYTASEKQFTSGESSSLECNAVKLQSKSIIQQLYAVNAEIEHIKSDIGYSTGYYETLSIPIPITKRTAKVPSTDKHPLLSLYSTQQQAASSLTSAEKARLLPDFRIGYTNQTFVGWQTVNSTDQYFNTSNRFSSFMVGIGVPLYFGAQSAKIATAEVQESIIALQYETSAKLIESERNKSKVMVSTIERSILEMESTVLPSARAILNDVDNSLRNGNISIIEWVYLQQSAWDNERRYIQLIADYNAALIESEFWNQPE